MGALASFLRGFRAAKPDPHTIARIKDWTAVSLGGSDEITLAVNEIACTDPACPGVETVILVMAPGAKTRAFKVGKPIEEVTEQDVAAALV